MIQDCNVLLIRVPRDQEGRVVTGGIYQALIATKEKCLMNGNAILFREWIQTVPLVEMSTDYEEIFRAKLANALCQYLKFGNAGKFKFFILDKLLSGKDYDIPISHLQMLMERLKSGKGV